MIVTRDDGKRWISRQMYVSQGEKIVCEVTLCKAIDDVDLGYPRVSDDAEFEANVALISDAPDLLAMLAKLVDDEYCPTINHMREAREMVAKHSQK